jgi:indole-3-glycerol phosphate synthase
MSILNEIIARKTEAAKRMARDIPLERIMQLANEAHPVRGFVSALSNTPAVIAEMKRRSPSKGSIRPDLNVAQQAVAYEAGGARALSVLTDKNYFGMDISDLATARNAVSIPALRKDFIVSEHAVCESRILGADAMLLIVAALEDAQLKDLHQLGLQLGMDVLVEIHNKTELERALAIDPPLLGINARNLHTYNVNLSVVGSLAAYVPKTTTVVAESGISLPQQINELMEMGIGAFLIGESLLRTDDPTRKLKELTGQLEAAL